MTELKLPVLALGTFCLFTACGDDADNIGNEKTKDSANCNTTYRKCRSKNLMRRYPIKNE